MAMHLIDRPHLEFEQPGYRGMSAVGSAALHAAIAVTLVALMRISSDEHVTSPMQALLPDHLIWIPSVAVGGGRDAGGERAPDPPRRARAIGQDPISVASSPQQPSIDATSEPPPDAAMLPALPMGDSTQIVAGAVESSGTSAGPGDAGTGTAPGSNQGGLGNQPSNGFGHGASPGGPGVTMPTLVERVAPKYTADAMRARIQGSVWIECVVMPDGSVGDARVIRSLDRRFGLDEEALSAARRWRFRSGRIDGKPVPVIVSIELTFSVR